MPNMKNRTRNQNYKGGFFPSFVIFKEEKPVNNNFYKINEVTQHKYYQVPKELYTNEKYKSTINNDAKMLYALLLDRMELSRANNWVDNDGTIFLIFTREALADMLGICTTTVWRAVKQLKEVGLIAEKRQGLNKPNLIYIGKIDYCTPKTDKQNQDTATEIKDGNSYNGSSLTSDIENLKVKIVNNLKSEHLKAKSQNFENLKTIKTDNIKPDCNKTDSSKTDSLIHNDEEKNRTADSS